MFIGYRVLVGPLAMGRAGLWGSVDLSAPQGTICSLPCPEGFHGHASQECGCHNGGLCDLIHRAVSLCSGIHGGTGEWC